MSSLAPSGAVTGSTSAPDLENGGTRRVGLIDALLLSALALASFAFCLYHLGARSLWLDEGASLSIASQHGGALLHGIGRDGGNQAFYYLLLHVVIGLFGTGTDVLRVPSAVAAALCVPLTYGLGRTLFDQRRGLYAAALVAFSEPLVYWGQMARGYTLVAALAAASGWSFASASQSGRSRTVAVWVIFSALACYSGIAAIGLVVVEAVTALAQRHRIENRDRILAGFGALVLLLVPLGLLSLARGKGQLFWVTRPTLRSSESTLRFVFSSLAPHPGHWESNVLNVASVTTIVATGLLGFLAYRRGRYQDADGAVFVLVWLLVPLIGAWLISVTLQPIFVDRYFSSLLPAMCVALAFAITAIPLKSLALAILCAVIALRVTQIPPSYKMVRDNWRRATAVVLGDAHPGDCIAFDANDGWVDFDYYLRRSSSTAARLGWLRPVLPTDAFSSDPVIDEEYSVLLPHKLASLSHSCTRLWLVDSHVTASNAPGSIAAAHHQQLTVMLDALAANYRQRSEIRFTDVTTFLYSNPATST